MVHHQETRSQSPLRDSRVRALLQIVFQIAPTPVAGSVRLV